MKKVRLYGLLLGTLALVLLTAGVSYAWFTQNAATTTLLKIIPPDVITIEAVSDQGESMYDQELNLDYHDPSDYPGSWDEKVEDGDTATYTIWRPIRVRSTSQAHQLEIVHTTNLTNLSFEIHPVPASDMGGDTRPSDVLQKECKNAIDNSNTLAEQNALKNYEGVTPDKVDAHAYPLYWLAEKCKHNAQEGSGYHRIESDIHYDEYDLMTGTEKDFYYTYYYLEITWSASSKETDLFYIMAKNET